MYYVYTKKHNSWTLALTLSRLWNYILVAISMGLDEIINLLDESSKTKGARINEKETFISITLSNLFVLISGIQTWIQRFGENND